MSRPDGVEGGGHAGLARGEGPAAGVPDDHAGRCRVPPRRRSTARGGSVSPGTRSTAMSSRGSNSATAAGWRPVESMTSGDGIPATTWALVTTRSGGDHEARALLDDAAPLPGHLDGGPLGPQHRGAGPRRRSAGSPARRSGGGARRRRRGSRSGPGTARLRRTPGGWGGARRRGHARSATAATTGRARCTGCLLQQDRHQPRDHQRRGHRHRDPERGVDRPETEPL